jgi:hypothetical protein
MKGAANCGGSFARSHYVSRLLKLCRDTAETRVQLGADAVYSSDDRHGDSRCDQTIFDGRRSRLILPKPGEKLRHEICS